MLALAAEAIPIAAIRELLGMARLGIHQNRR